MIGRRQPRISDVPQQEVTELKSFDDFEVRLGDMMRGERATMGKSLLDVQRELRIKASYIAAIENSDPSAFDTQGFISGYVKSYARYLNLDPEETFRQFCAESGFAVAHGMSAEASGKRKTQSDELMAAGPLLSDKDPFTSPNTPFVPTGESVWLQIEPRAIGSTMVLIALICGIGYGGWSLLKEVQQVQFAPVDETPVVLSELDPLQGAASGPSDLGQEEDVSPIVPTAEALDRLYRPKALDVPVLVARDAPIATLDPRTVGTFRSPSLPNVQITEDQTLAGLDLIEPGAGQGPQVPQVLEDAVPTLRMVTVRPSWVRVSSADGSVLFEGIMEAGGGYDVPLTEEPPLLRAGESGAVYFAVGDQHFGPVGTSGSVTSNISLSVGDITTRYQLADLEQDQDLARMVAEARTGAVPEE